MCSTQQELDIKRQLQQLSLSLLEQEQVEKTYSTPWPCGEKLTLNIWLQAVAQASYYLPSYDSRQVASTISSLRDQIEAAKQAHLGKKKFGFSRKAKKVVKDQSPLAELHNNSAEQAMSTPHQAKDTTLSGSSALPQQQR